MGSLPSRVSDAGPDVRPRLCRCGNLSTERADCVGCGACVCPHCPHAVILDNGETYCEVCVAKLAIAWSGEDDASVVPDMREAVRERLNGAILADAETIENWKLTAAVGLDVTESAIYLAYTEGRVN